MTLPNFQVIGDYLRKKYEASVHLPTAVDLNELIPMMNRNELSAILSGQSTPPPVHSNFIQITTNQPSLDLETNAGAPPDSLTSNRSRDEPSASDSEPLMADAPTSPARVPLSGHFIPVTPVSSSANPPTPAPSHFNYYYERHKQLQQASGSGNLPTSPPAANRQKQPDPVSGDLMQILTNTTLLSQEEYQALLKDMKLCSNAASRAKQDSSQQASSNQVGPAGSLGQKQLHKKLSQQQNSQASSGQQTQHLIKIANQHLSQLLHSNKDDLIHLHKSPDYCEADPRHGFPGIQSRVCSNNPLAPNNCDKLCCGRGFTTHVYQQTFKCDCKFQYCCSIYCSVCEKEVKVIDCN